MSYFVKMLGSTDWPMPNDAWSRSTDDRHVRFAPKPVPSDVNVGDSLLYYAVGGYKRVFAAADVESTPEVVDDVENPEVSRRWPYLARVKVWESARVKYVSSGPELGAISPDLQRKIGHGVGYFEIGRDDFERGLQLLRAAKTEEESKLARGWRPA